MISLTEENRVATRIGGLRVTCVFPSFADLIPDIRSYVGRPMIFSAQGKLQDSTEDRLLDVFSSRCKRVEGLKVRGEDRKVADVTDLTAATSMIPDLAKVKVCETIFGIPTTADFRPMEAMGDPTIVLLPVMGQEVLFSFPPMDDPDFQKAVKELLGDHSVGLGTQVMFNTHAARLKFYRENCKGVGEIDGRTGASLDGIPENWIAGACMAFSRQEALGGQDLGNS